MAFSSAKDQVNWKAGVWEAFDEELRAGFRLYPWGGAEVGGILLGKLEPHAVIVESFRMVPCEHAFGPSYELSDNDKAALTKILESARDYTLEVVGWFHSVSYREAELTAIDIDLFHRFFPERGQIGIIVRRSANEDSVSAVFRRLGDEIRQITTPVVETKPTLELPSPTPVPVTTERRREPSPPEPPIGATGVMKLLWRSLFSRGRRRHGQPKYKLQLGTPPEATPDRRRSSPESTSFIIDGRS